MSVFDSPALPPDPDAPIPVSRAVLDATTESVIQDKIREAIAEAEKWRDWPSVAPYEGADVAITLAAEVKRLREEVARLRQGVARVASRLIDGLLDQRLEDGTPTIEVVLAQNPELRERLIAVLQR